MKIFRYLAAVIAAISAIACGQVEPEKTDEKKGFEIEIHDLHSSYCQVKVTPENPSAPYFLGVATEAYFAEFGSMDESELGTTVANFIETQMIMNPDLSLDQILHKGEYNREVTGLQPEQTFVVFACYTDPLGTPTSEITLIKETTPPVTESETHFEIEIDQITATSATIFITPSNDEPYVWLELPDYVYEGMSMEELKEFLLKNYKPFFPLHTTNGEMMHSFDGKLEPDTEYMIIVFGYDGGMTTPLTIEKFRTQSPNDATDVTFEFTYSELTSRSVSMTFIPSDNSVSYFAIVVDEATLEKSGGPTADGVKKLIDKEIQKALAFGECDNRAEFAEYNSHRGKQTGSFGLIPGMKHYACAVCVDSKGEYASEVAIAEFDAPAEESTDASVSASFSKWFDGDDLATADPEAYGDYAGWAVLPVSFELGGAAAEALYTIYPVSILEEEGATEEDIRELLLNNDLLGTYNFYTESKVTVQLEWDCAYKLFAIAFDENKNAGDIFTLDIPALSKSGASPAADF